MPSCYLLAVCLGSSVDQHSNNVTLFSLVEQVNVPPGAPPPPRGMLPLEVHAYFRMSSEEMREPFEIRFALVARSGLETYSEVFSHKSVTPRYRTRTFGIPYPPVADQYELRVDWRVRVTDPWHREPVAWPIGIAEHSPAPAVTH